MLINDLVLSNSLLSFPEPLYKVFHDATLYGDGTRSRPLRVLAGGLPTQTGHTGEFLTTDGTTASWVVNSASTLWGGITGTLSNQTDLQSALNAKLSSTLPGADTQVLFNNAGSLGASANLTWNGTYLLSNIIKSGSGATMGFGAGDGYWFIDREGLGNSGAMRFSGKLYSVHGDVAAFKFTDFSSTVLTSINTTGQFNITPLTLVSAEATSALNIAQTWNTTGTPTAIKLNVTNSASNAASQLIDLQVGGSSKFKVGLTGNVVIPNNGSFGNANTYIEITDNNRINYIAGSGSVTGQAHSFLSISNSLGTSGETNYMRVLSNFSPTSGTGIFNSLGLLTTINQTGGANGITRGIYISPTLTASADYYAIESTQGTVKLTDTTKAGSGSLAGSLLDLAQTWNTTGTPTAIKLNVTNTASDAASKLIDLQVSTNTRFDVTKTGFRFAANANSSSGIYYASMSLQPITFFGSDSTAVTINNNIDGGWAAVLFKGNTGATTSQIKSSSTVFAPSTGTNTMALFDSTYAVNSTGGTNTVTGFKLNATETSLTGTTHALMDLQVAGVSKFKVDRTGQVILSAGNLQLPVNYAVVNTTTTSYMYFNQNVKGLVHGDFGWRFEENSSGHIETSGAIVSYDFDTKFNPTSGTATHANISVNPTVNQTGGANGITRGLYINPTLTAAADFRALETTNGKVILTDTFSAVTGSLAGSLLTLNQTWNTTGAPTAVLLNVTNTASAFASYLMDLQVAGVSKFAFRKDGNFLSSGNTLGPNGLYVQNSGWVEFTGRSQVRSSSDGTLLLNNNAQTDFNRLQFGGTTSSFPAIKRSSAGLVARLADDSADTTITASNVISTATVRLKGYTVATLPTGVVGDLAYVTDALTPAFGVTIVGGGAVVTPVFYDGTTWTAR